MTYAALSALRRYFPGLSVLSSPSQSRQLRIHANLALAMEATRYTPGDACNMATIIRQIGGEA